MTQATVPGMRLATLIHLATIVGSVLLSIGLVAFLGSYSQTVTDRALDRAIRVRAQSSGLDFARAIDADWQELRDLGERLRTIPAGELRSTLGGMVGNGSRVAWVGFAGLDGRVAVASFGLLEGADVSKRPWFHEGLERNYAGDVRDAVLLNRLLGGTDDNPVQFIDLAVPVTAAGGTAVGVLSAHLNASWAERYLAESAAIRGIDLYLVNPAGEVVIATAPAPEDPSALQVFRAAAAGVATSVREEWPDGRVYQASVVPTVTYGDLPSFGWRLVARIPAEAFASDRSDLLRMALTLVLGCVALVILSGIVFVRLFVAPIARIADAALSISAGADTYPPESRSSREASALSAALARLQTRLRGRPEV